MRRPIVLLSFVVLASAPFALAGCPSHDTVVAIPPAPMPSQTAIASATSTATAPPPLPALGLSPDDDAALDRSVSPCDDFYQYACGGWMKATKIPDDEASWMRSFSVIRQKNEELLKEILEADALAKSKDPLVTKLGDFYASCMDEAAIEKQGTKPLDAEMRRIAEIHDKSSIARVIGGLHERGVNALWSIGSQQDFHNATRIIGAIEQSGLGMPDRDYYLKDDAKMRALRDTYTAHVEAMFALAGDKPDVAHANAATVLTVEHGLAEVQMTKEDRRDPKKVDHPTTRDAIMKDVADIDWDTYFKHAGAKDAKDFNVAQPAYLKATSEMLASKVPLADWKVYLRWQVLNTYAKALPARFVDEDFKWTAALRGTAKLAPRWKRCVRATDAGLGEALAQPFVEKTLGPQGKASAQETVRAIEAAMKTNLESLAWMDSETREKAQAKLAKIANKIAYPDKWRDYDALKVDRKSWFTNLTRATVFEGKRQLAKIGKPVDRGEWQMTPPTVNAYYDASMNEMVFPAGILQPPFYSNDAPRAQNFGGIGMVMGHELTHGFDDEGRQFDGEGNLKSWWTKNAGDEFDKRASCVEKQFDSYTVLGDVHVNGKLTLGENIADLGGMRLAFAALEADLAKNKLETPAGTFTPEQRFFLGFAQSWCGNLRDEYLRLLVSTNPHSPPMYRVNGPLSNLSEFSRTWSCDIGSKMAPKDRCEVW